jgi:hypothetical protein
MVSRRTILTTGCKAARAVVLTTLLSAVLSMHYVDCARASEEGLLDRIKAVEAPFDNRTVVKTQPVVAATVLAKEDHEGVPFKVLARKQAIERYPCSSCHNNKEVKAKNTFVLTHGNVVLNHGREGSGLSCIDCHHPDEREYLEDKKGRKIDFDHSYQLCGQCHFRQKRDWLGGAHGKREKNWTGERVVYNCTSCHDPHSPRFEKRFPAIYSVPLD